MTFRVFIGSTSDDLRRYRDIARDVCEELGLLAIRMETWPAMGRGATAGSLRELDKADVYVGIVAWRYGYVEPGYDRSVTAEEHRYAGQRQIERLCFLADPAYEWPPGLVDDDRGRINGFRAEVEREIRSHFTTTDNFKAGLINALVEWRSRQPPESALAAPDPHRVEENLLRTLTALCESVSISLLLDCYRGVIGDWVVTDHLTDATRIIDRLSDGTEAEPRAIPPLVKFAIGLEQRSDDLQSRARVTRWLRKAAAHHGVDDDAVEAFRVIVVGRIRRATTTDRLLVRLDDSPPEESFTGGVLGSREPPRYVLRVMVQHGDDPPLPLDCADNRAFLLTEVRDEVVGSVRAWTRYCQSGEVSFEFLVPTALLGEPFDQWLVPEAGDDDASPLGMLFGVSVRDVGRADRPPSAKHKDRWEQLHTSQRPPRGLLHWVPPTLTKLSQLRSTLLDHKEWAYLAFERFAGGRTGPRLLAVGIELDAPVMVWMRASGEDADTVLADLKEQLRVTPPPELPAKLLNLRRQAMQCSEPVAHCGQHVGLLWDDPEQRPPVTRPLDIPG